MPSSNFDRSTTNEQEVADIRIQLAALTEAEWRSELAASNSAARARKSEWLKIIYETKRQTFQKELDRSWNVQQFMLPLSLTPLLALAVADSLRVGQVIVLAVVSCFLLFMSNAYVDRLTWRQYRADTWLKAIEAEVGLEDMRTVPKLDLPPWNPSRYGFSIFRRSMLVLLFGIWVALIIAVDRSWI